MKTFFLLIALFLLGATAASAQVIKIAMPAADLELLNVKEVRDVVALRREASELMRRVDADELVPLKVMLWEGHPLVRDIGKEPALRIRRNGHHTLLFPLQHKGRQLVLYRLDDYRGYALKKELDLNGLVR